MNNKNITIVAVVALVIAVVGVALSLFWNSSATVGAIGTNPVENYIPIIKQNEGYYSELPVQTTSTITATGAITGGSLVGPVTATATSTFADVTMTSSATTSLKILSTSSTQGGCIQINATSTNTSLRLMLSPLGATSTFGGTVYFDYGTCE